MATSDGESNPLPRNAGRFDFIGDDHVIRPDVVLPFTRAHYTPNYRSRVHADPHVDVDLSRGAQHANIVDHLQAQVDAVSRVSSIFNRHSGNPVIAIAEKLDAQHIVFLFKWLTRSFQ